MKTKHIVNGKVLSPFEAGEHEALSHVFASTITFIAILFVLGFVVAGALGFKNLANAKEAHDFRIGHPVAVLDLSFGEDLTRALESMTWPEPIKIVQVTTYNAEVGQTDSSPCIAAGGEDICYLAKQGVRPIALSWDLAEWTGGNIPYRSKITLKHWDPRCNGEFTVLDAMNSRWRNKVDVFMLDRKNNTSCKDAILIR